MRKSAAIDSSGLYRYSLEREWNLNTPRIAFVMLNPSTADATNDDPTIRRCIRFAQSWNYGALEVVNLFAYRTKYPVELLRVGDPVGAENDRHILAMMCRVQAIVVAWGNQGRFQQRHQNVIRLLTNQLGVYCLGMTRLGYPRHPLYIKGDTNLMAFAPLFTKG